MRHVGDQVAAVIARSAAEAQDAAEAVEVDYEELPALTDVGDALSPESPVLHPEFETNVAHVVSLGDPQAVRAAFARAAHVSELDIRTTRVTGSAIEPRAYLGAYDPADGRYTLHATSQVLQPLRRWLAADVFDLPVHRFRVISPDVGGGFGTKAYFYPEIPVVLHASCLVGRPVRFTATRQEGYASDTHARDFLTRARLALDAEGRMLGLELEALAGHGAYESSFNALIAGVRYGNLATCLYRTPAAHVRVDRGVHQHPAHRRLPRGRRGADHRRRAPGREGGAGNRPRPGRAARAQLPLSRTTTPTPTRSAPNAIRAAPPPSRRRCSGPRTTRHCARSRPGHGRTGVRGAWGSA